MEAKKLIRAKVGIILNNPFFATLMMKREFIEDSSIETACTNGKKIKYNPAFFDSLSHDEMMGVICHELLHITLLHHTRREGRELKQWNKACDYALNPILLNSGITLPEGHLIDDRFTNFSAEQIFKVLAQEKQEKQDEKQDEGNDESNDAGGTGGVEDAPVHSESELVQAEAEAKQELAQALQIAKSQGKLPVGLERLVNEVLQPKIAWQEVLNRFLSEIAKNDYSFSRPNQRYLSSGFILPSLYNVEVGEIVLVVDTSGSVDEILLNSFAGEMQDICTMLNSSIRIIYVDDEFQGEQEIEPNEPFILTPKGFGSTDFKPAFNWLNEQGIEPKALIYFTDLCCHSFPVEPEYPVLWAKYGAYQSNHVPFGEIIQVD